MKKICSLLLSVLFMISALPMVSADDTKGTNVALGRPGFSISHAGKDHADKATDGSLDTIFCMSGGKTEDIGDFDETAWYYVDLGTEYSIDSIDLTVLKHEAHNVGFEVYLSNTRASATTVPQEGEKTVVRAAEQTCTMEESGNKRTTSIDVAAQNVTGKFRFVYVTKRDAGTNDGINISELAVYTKDTVADDAPYWVEIASGKPSFASSHFPGYAAWMANDRDASTTYVGRNIVPVWQRFVVDLGKEYPLTGVVLRTRESNENEMKGYKIYGTNDTLFTQQDIFHDQGAETAPKGNKFYAVPEAFLSKTYRYVVFEKPYSAAVDAYARDISITDFLVYTSDTSAAKNTDNSERTILISRDTPVILSQAENATYLNKYLNDNTTEATHWLSAANISVASDIHVYMDLQIPQSIDYVTYSLSDWSNYMYGLQVVATNDPSFAAENDAVLYQAKNASGAWFSPVSANSTRGIILFEATEAMKGQKYRYVGLRFPPNGNMIRGAATSLDVYTKSKNLQEAHNGITLSREGETGRFSASSAMFVSNGGPYNFIAAAYDENDALIEVRTKSQAMMTKGVYQELSMDIDFSDSENKAKIRKIKTMLWDTMNAIRPVTASKTYDIDGFYSYQLVSGNATTCKASKTATATTYEKGAGQLTDDNLTTGYASGPANALYSVFIDLGEEGKRFDKVEITAYDTYNRTKGMKYYLANTVPVPGADTSGWVYLGEQDQANVTTASSPGATRVFDLDETSAGQNWRYIVVDMSANNVGGYVYEISAYEKVAQ